VQREASMLELFWRAAYRDWKRVESTNDSSFEMVVIFSLSGLVLTMLLLPHYLFSPAAVSAATMFPIYQ
jgi:hypothetical protein